MKSLLVRMAVLMIFSPVVASASADLYFSEYIEGSSFNKALEIYNDTGSSVDLSAYQIQFYYNGNSNAGRTVVLSGVLADGEVFVVADSKAGQEIQAVANLLGGTSWFNGDDAVVLQHNGVAVDVIGQIGMDPGSQWGNGLNSTQNNTLHRKTSVTGGDANGFDMFDPAMEWDGFAQDSFGDLGIYGAGNGGPVSRCGDPAQGIHEVQGSGGVSPLVGATVSVEAVVTADFQSDLRGFFLQEDDDEVDDDPLTSEGIFVYSSNAANISVGDRIRVIGQVKEYHGLTELVSSADPQVCASGMRVTPADLSLPFDDKATAERFEGMAVLLPQVLTVSENYNLGRYGELLLSYGRLYQPTHVAAPGAEAGKIAQANALNQITLDDASNRQNPDPIVFPAPGLTAATTLRSGDSVQGLQGVVTYAYGKYRLYPTFTPEFLASNPRTVMPLPEGGQVRVASFNVLNYFIILDSGAPICGPSGDMGCRGADSVSEFERQQAKIVQAIVDMQADVIGLMELQNNGYGPDSAIAQLVNAINAQSGNDVQYAFVDPGVAAMGTDAIAVGLIYNVKKVKIAGKAAILDTSIDSRFIDNRNRPALAVSFKDRATHQRFTVAVNHFKSKGSSCDDIGDPDTGDGQGNCNVTRTQAAHALVDWLASKPTGVKDPDVLIIGDLNSYAKEDPINAIKAVGYTDLIEDRIGDEAYSYVFYGQAGYLDHALVSEEAAEQVEAVTEWHINADEPRVLDYNEEYKSANQIVSLYSADPYRASDHDPVVIDMQLLARCDLDKDGKVNWYDKTAFKKTFRSYSGDRNYLRRADMDRDGDVDRKDRSIFKQCVRRYRERSTHWRDKHSPCCTRKIRRNTEYDD